MKRSTLIIISIGVVLLLAGAAFIGARLLSSTPEQAGGPVNQMVIQGPGGGGPVQISLKFQPAPELPPTPPEVKGVFDRRADNSIFVGTGDIEVNMQVDGNTGEKQMNTSFSGPVVEVVVTRETTLYRDETKMPNPASMTWCSCLASAAYGRCSGRTRC